MEGMALLEDFIDLPWPNIAGFLTCTALLLFTFGPKFPFLVKFFSTGIQELVGVTGLREDLNSKHEENSTKLSVIEEKIDRHERDDVIHRRDSNAVT